MSSPTARTVSGFVLAALGILLAIALAMTGHPASSATHYFGSETVHAVAMANTPETHYFG